MSTDVSVPALTAQRTAPATYTVRNANGGEFRIGAPGAEDGSFSPVEILQAAAAACAALSAEAKLANRLGEGFDATSTVEAEPNMDDNRIERLITHVEADMSELDAETRQKLIASAERSIDSLCTVKRTLNHGAVNTTEVSSQG
jgi:uncharacterized OsmC-like protein